MRPVLLAVVCGLAVGYLVGFTIDVWDLWRGSPYHSFGFHLAVQLPACFVGMFAGAWWMDRRAKARR